MGGNDRSGYNVDRASGAKAVPGGSGDQVAGRFCVIRNRLKPCPSSISQGSVIRALCTSETAEISAFAFSAQAACKDAVRAAALRVPLGQRRGSGSEAIFYEETCLIAQDSITNGYA